MKAKYLFIWFIATHTLCCSSPLNAQSTSVIIKDQKVETPFGLVTIKEPDFRKSARLSIINFGAKENDKINTTLAIEKAIDKANKMGGGVVIVPQGNWLTGKIHLKSNVNLHLDKGAVLIFSGDPSDYLPAVPSSWEGLECLNYSPLIYAYECKNVAITGQGEIKAIMDVWEKWFSRPPAHMASIKRLYNLAQKYAPLKERNMINDTSHLRPQFIQMNRSENILIQDITITNSPFWTMHLFLSKDVVIRNVKVHAHGHNNDGVDPEMSQNVLIENCVFDQGDDAIAIKSGRNPEGWRLKTPSKNIIIRNNLVKEGHELVAIGSELSGGIENVFIDNCKVAESAQLTNYLLFIKTNERMGGYVRNIYASNISAPEVKDGVLGIDTDALYQWRKLVPTVVRKLTPIKNIFLENIKVADAKFVSRIMGQAEIPIKNVSLKNITVEKEGHDGYILENVEKFSVR